MKTYKLPRKASDRPASLYADWLLLHCEGLQDVYDIGAGDGVIKERFGPNVRYEGIDLGSDIFARTEDVVYVENSKELSETVRKHEAVDLVTLMDVLEHTETFTPLFEDALSISGRYVFVSLPNELWLYNRVRFLCGHTVPCHSFEMIGKKPGHKHAWLVHIPRARQLLNEVAESAGFQLEAEVGQTFAPNSPIWKIVYGPLNAICGIDLVAQGWGGLWKKK